MKLGGVLASTINIVIHSSLVISVVVATACINRIKGIEANPSLFEFHLRCCCPGSSAVGHNRRMQSLREEWLIVNAQGLREIKSPWYQRSAILLQSAVHSCEMNSTCKRTTSTPDELEVENQPPCNTKNDHHDCVHCPARRQRCDPLTPRVVIDKQTLESVQPHRSSPLWKQPQFSRAELATSESHSMGWFKTLPDELLYNIFELLEFRSLSLISMTSRNMSTAALTYLQSAKGLKHVMPIVSAGHMYRAIIDPMEFRGVGEQHNNYVTCCCNYYS